MSGQRDGRWPFGGAGLTRRSLSGNLGEARDGARWAAGRATLQKGREKRGRGR